MNSHSPRPKYFLFTLALMSAALLFSLSVLAAETSVTNGCTPLARGEFRKFEGAVGTPVARHYTLVRVDDQVLARDFRSFRGDKVARGTAVPDFEALLNIRFLNDDEQFDAALDRKFAKLVRDCYDIASQKIRGPQGEFLRLLLARERPQVEPAELVEIAISPYQGYRTRSRKWESDPECATILHETFHLLGLVDEYPEKEFKVPATGLPYFDCRAIGPISSIMHRQSSAFMDSGLTWLWRTLGIRGRPSLLFEGQFNTIVAPECPSSSGVYNACSLEFKRTSAAHGGAGCSPDRLSVCSNPDWVHEQSAE